MIKSKTIKSFSISELLKLKQERDTLLAENEALKFSNTELESTNSHLISATWREREIKRKLSETLDELSNTKLIVENQNKRISESINYSKKIQATINPTEQDIQKHFDKSFLVYMPKDVISGDFPWTFETSDYFYMASVDCTGHGVPGAMMSMIGNLLLTQIVNDQAAPMPSHILLELHKKVVKTLRQYECSNNSNDGMDIGLCRINKSTREVVFAGAHRPLYLMRKGEISVISGDKFPIGGMHHKGKNNYQDHIINYQENDSIFLFTDGLPDQVGGPEKKKLMPKNVKAFIESQANLSMPELKTALINFFASWKGSNKQVDDILILGISF